ncbi:MAG: hypothetical protein U9R15_15525 [Chloroflexota bacterium]|nr:hypothetical protein [Chloroflexota bacterium]
MTLATFEQHIRDEARRFAFIRNVVALDRTANTVKLRLFIATGCFVQVYTNLHKDLLSYTLVLRRTRIYGRDNDGTGWHRHPHSAPNSHDFSDEGTRPVSLAEFLDEVQQILTVEGIL